MTPAFTSIPAALDSHALTRPDDVAVRVYPGHGRDEPAQEATFAELVAAGRERARRLRDTCRPGDRVLTACPTSLDLVVTIVACLTAGLPVVICPPLERPGIGRQRALAVLRDARPSLVVVDGDIGEWRDLAAPGTRVCSTREPSPEAMASPEEGWRGSDPDPDGVAVIQYSSGSTADPRGIVLPHRAITANVRSILSTYALSEQDRYCGWLPLHHDMGLVGQLLTALYVGGTTSLMLPSDFVRQPRRWLSLLSETKATITAAPNFALDLVVRRLRESDLDGLDLSALRVLLNGSEPIDPEVIRRFCRALAPAGLDPQAMAPSYGLAEATLFVTGHDVRERLRLIGSSRSALGDNRIEPSTNQEDEVELVDCGPPRECTVRIVDPASATVLTDGKVGEIWVSGQSVADGYWGQSGPVSDAVFAAHTACEDGPFLRTGDLGALVGGRLVVTGRIKELAIINGRNIYPTDAERIVSRLRTEFTGCSGVFFSTAAPGEEAVMVQEIRAPGASEETLSTVAETISSELTRELGVAVSNVLLVRPGTLPRTTSGKLQRRLTAALVLSGRLSTVYEATNEALRRRRPVGDES